MRILAIDYGRKKCGIAISDKENKIAIPHSIVKTDELFEFLRRIIKEKDIKKIIIGLPLSLSGKEIELTREVYKLKQVIESEFKIGVELLDERMTSKIFKNAQSDDLSASILLENYLSNFQS